MFAFRPDRLFGVLDELADGDGKLKDFGDGLLPRLVEAWEAVEYRLEGYWRDLGTVPAYWRAHMDLLNPERSLDLDDPAWPILSRVPLRLPARGGALVERAVIDRRARIGRNAKVGESAAEVALVGGGRRGPPERPRAGRRPLRG